MYYIACLPRRTGFCFITCALSTGSATKLVQISAQTSRALILNYEYDRFPTHSSVAQLVEQLAVNELVVGSNPTRGARYKKSHEMGFFV